MRKVEGRRWTREEYERMIQAGVLAPAVRVELVDGEILNVTPQGSAHATAIRLGNQALSAIFRHGHTVQVRLPLALDPISEPEPDLSVVVGGPRNYRAEHPGSAVLILEIADTTLDYDRQRKGRVYARAGITDYWIVNIIENCLEVYRQPGPEGYTSCQVLRPGEAVAPLASPGTAILVDDLLP
jgi:Uma2 family endonuclease